MDEQPIPGPSGDTRSSTDAPARAALDAALVSVRRRLRGHAGDVAVADVSDGVVTLDYRGACRGCPAVNFTHVAVVEPALSGVHGVKSVAPPRSDIAPAVLNRIRRMMSKSG
ncbi:MAG TPA: NifU family protein [Solirubrobacteraceae bacterium]